MKSYKEIELTEDFKVIDRVTIGVMCDVEEELETPFSSVNFMFVKNQVILLKHLSNKVIGQNFTNEQIGEFFDNEMERNGNLDKIASQIKKMFAEKKKAKKQNQKK